MMVATVFMPSSALALQDSCMPQALHCQWLTKLITVHTQFLNTGQNIMLINLGHQKNLASIASILSPAVPLIGLEVE